DFDSVGRGRSGKVSQLTGIRSCNQDSPHKIKLPDLRLQAGTTAFRGRVGRSRSHTIINITALTEIHPPTALSHVRTNLTCTRFIPASTGTSICPVSGFTP